MPGGQYTNLQQQASAVGLTDEWDKVKEMYADVNKMFGDIVKVTPSSKVVGDMALFMVQNKLNEEDIYAKGDTIDFPESVISFFKGDLGQPTGGFPDRLQEIILKGKKAFRGRKVFYAVHFFSDQFFQTCSIGFVVDSAVDEKSEIWKYFHDVFSTGTIYQPFKIHLNPGRYATDNPHVEM